MTGPSGFDPVRGTGSDEVWEMLSRWRAERRRFVLATVIESRGFTPRKPGAHMLIGAGGETTGTIGGGAIEQLVLEHARALVQDGGATIVKRHLTQELGMCCGGEMSVFLEVIAPAPRLFVFGAGYIAKPLASLATACGFDVTVVDERPEWADPARFPQASVECRSPEDFSRALQSTPEDYAVVATHDHALDQRVVQELLRRPFRFLGMIGSVPKQRKFALRLRARGFSDADIARLHTPLGLPIGAQTPEEIAVSALAEIIAVRRGVPLPLGWTPPRRSAADEEAAEGETGAGVEPSPRESRQASRLEVKPR